MTLFQANKKQTWQFNAQYSKDCAWNRFQLHGDMPTQSESGYRITYNDLYVRQAIYICTHVDPSNHLSRIITLTLAFRKKHGGTPVSSTEARAPMPSRFATVRFSAFVQSLLINLLYVH